MSAFAPAMSAAAVFVLVAVVVVAVVGLARFEIGNPVVALLRVLIPSWRFFDAIGDHCQLLARVAGPDGRFGPWLALLGPPPRAWWNVVWHPDGNLSLACHSLLDRLQADLAAGDDDEDPEQLVSYRVVLDLVRWSVRGQEGAALVQFELIGSSQPPACSHRALIVSAVHARAADPVAASVAHRC